MSLVPFCPVVVSGSKGASYEVTRKEDHIYCTCLAWKFMRAPIQERQCKHILQLLEGGDTSSTPPVKKRKRDADPSPCTPLSKTKRNKCDLDAAFEPALAEKWTTEDPMGWYRSEKLDGVRCVWTGTRLLSRNQNEIHAPPSLVAELPSMKLDGELFIGRGRFTECMSVVRTQVPNVDRWKKVTYQVFDAPEVPGTFKQRIAAARDAIRGCSWAKTVKQTLCTDAADVQNALKKVVRRGGEGLMLRHPTRAYRGGRTHDLLKVKVMHDAEAVIIGHDEGSGRNRGRLGAFVCIDDAGIVFKVGSGISERLRDDPPTIGTRITYQFQEKTPNGKPRFPVFLRPRLD